MEEAAMSNSFIKDLSLSISRIEAAYGNADAWPRVCKTHLELLTELAQSPRPLHLGEIQATSNMVPSCAQVTLSALAGLLAIHSAPVTIRRERVAMPKTGRWAYFYRLAKVED